ncbi:MAG TPA: YceK/YidQ family lipoprotein [Geobacteraceae bacterium]
MRIIAKTFLIVLAISLGGCASLYATFAKNEKKPNEPITSESWVYTGVKTDGMLLAFSIYCIGGGHGCGDNTNWLFIGSPLMIADVPLSLVADTIFLPYTLHKEHKSREEAP